MGMVVSSLVRVCSPSMNSIKPISASGHTQSGALGKRVSIRSGLCDVLHNTAQIHELGWCSRADIDPAVAQATRRSLVDKMEQEDLTVVAVHLPKPGFGKIVRGEGRRYWQSL